MNHRRLIVAVVAFGVLVAACSGEESTAAEEPMSDVPTAETTSTTSGTGSAANEAGGFIIRDGDLVAVHYVGTLDDGSLFDSSRDRGEPLSFTVGSGQVIAGFDEAVRGGKVGEVRTSRMEAKNAYGEWSEDNLIVVPFNPDQGDVKAGDDVFLTNGQPAVVLEVTAESVTLDANHPLAGQALTFEVEILSITRE